MGFKSRPPLTAIPAWIGPDIDGAGLDADVFGNNGGLGILNRVYLTPVYVVRPVRVVAISFNAGDTTGGNGRLGLYQRTYTRLQRIADTGLFAVPPRVNGVAYQQALPAPVSIGAGSFYIAAVCDVNGSSNSAFGGGSNPPGNVPANTYYVVDVGAITLPQSFEFSELVDGSTVNLIFTFQLITG